MGNHFVSLSLSWLVALVALCGFLMKGLCRQHERRYTLMLALLFSSIFLSFFFFLSVCLLGYAEHGLFLSAAVLEALEGGGIERTLGGQSLVVSTVVPIDFVALSLSLCEQRQRC